MSKINLESGFFEYKIEYWDEIEQKLRKACGVTYAATHAEAVKNLEIWYGVGNINKIKISSPEPGIVFDFEESYLFKIKVKKNKGDTV